VPKCSFYRLHQQAVRPSSMELPGKSPWCAHPQSKVTVFAAAGTMGGARLLQCGGEHGKCTLTIPPEQPPKP